MTITRAQVSKQVKTPPKPKKKPMTPKETQAMIDRGNRMSELESKANRALTKDTMNKKIAKKGTQPKPNNYKCGGKVKKKK